MGTSLAKDGRPPPDYVRPPRASNWGVDENTADLQDFKTLKMVVKDQPASMAEKREVMADYNEQSNAAYTTRIPPPAHLLATCLCAGGSHTLYRPCRCVP
jgi:hypothetical protein